jgi:putative SOS response-associated peptidase YedK
MAETSRPSRPSATPSRAGNAAGRAFYEWKKTPAGKQPYAIVGADGLPLAMAGLWERWKDRSTGDTVQTFTIITTVPQRALWRHS